jgi:allophanate hydrolase
MPTVPSLDLLALRAAYRDGRLAPTDVVRTLYRRLAGAPDGIWIHRCDEAGALARARALEAGDRSLPLWGIPFAIKDNIDVAGLPTTAGCPGFAYVAEQTAPVVDRLLAAGAILIGKTNLDQFATGLVGTRSPYGACRNAFDPDVISGGSSAGSAVAVAAGLVSFALGTDTAGSGRVPAGLNNIVGLKPSLGLLSNGGVVPACKSLDTLSVFALTVEDARQILVQAGAEVADAALPAAFRFGVPAPSALEFFGDRCNGTLFAQAVARLQLLGGEPVEIDFAPFVATAELLYEGPWVSERYAAIKTFFDRDAERLLPVTRSIIGQGVRYSAVDLFQALYRLAELRQATGAIMAGIDLLVVPTVPRSYTIAEVDADPVTLNSRLGYYTNFVNLLDYCALAVPAALRDDGLPFGITLIAPAGRDAALTGLGSRFHRATGLAMGATGVAVPEPERPVAPPAARGIRLAVVGAHLTGQPLNGQLTRRNGRLLGTCRTAPDYRLYALPGTTPPKPGLARADAGASIEVEIWELDAAAFGSFVAEIPAPLGIGTLRLDDGSEVKGFICEPFALADADDITAYGGWRGYRAAVDFSAPSATVSQRPSR